MYRDYFQLKENPFALTPDPRFLFLSHHHREAMAHLLYGMGEMGGFVQVTGEVGTGKTTLCRSLLEQAPEQVDVALILNPKLNATELVASICDELKVSYPEGCTSVKSLVDCLNRHLLTAHAGGRRTVLVIDEAQNLSPEVLEQVRLLTNLETSTNKLLQILLLGQPELKSVMETPELRQLSQRITARYHLTPLRLEETIAYIHHRLDVAGCHRPLFSPSALRMIHRLSHGVPRLINIICDRALLGAYARRRLQVDKALVRKAAGEVTGEPALPKRRPLVWLAAAGLCCLVALAGWAALRPKGPDRPATLQMTDPQISATPSTAARDAAMQAPAGATAEVNAEAVPGTGIVPVTSAEPPEDTAPEPPATPGGERDPETAFAREDRTAPDSAAAETVAAPAGDLDLQSAESPPVENMAAPEPAPEPLQFGDLLNGGQIATDTDAAFATLFSYWQADYGRLPGDTACERAESAGLKCFHDRGNWNTLMTYNRPAVLELVDKTNRLHDVVLVGMRGDEVTIDYAGKPVAFARSEIERYWYGEFILLWKAPSVDTPVMGKGSRGPGVRRLRYWLDRAEGAETRPEKSYSGFFDDALEQRVVAFQRSHRVTADGLVGEQTWLLLNTAAGDPPAPVLNPPAG
jgi:general secretion pathway protein A